MIHGKDIIIYEGDENPVAIAASKSCTVDKVAGTIETSSPASGVARSYASGRTDWVATLNNLVLSVKDYMLRVGETYYLTIGVRGSSTDTISGYAICTECNVTGTVGNLAQGSFRFQGSDREGTIPPQPGETGYDMTEDQVTAIVYNVVGDGYLSRLHNDTAQGLITFNAGAYIPVGQYLRIGDAYLTYDAEYGMLKVWDGSGVVERGLYATGSVSALGAASGGGGGGGGGGDMDRDAMFAILRGAPASASEWISAKFLKLGPGLAAANDGTLTITGAVTSVGLTMPTGFTVSGSPITSSGVIAVSLASGYKLLQSSTATPGTYTKVTVDTYGRVTAGSTLSPSDIPVLPASKVPNIEDLDNFSTHVYDATVSRTANTVLAGPSSGSASPATFRALVPADIPTNISITGNAAMATKATQDGDGNVITSKYVTLDTVQTISAIKTFSATVRLNGVGIEAYSGAGLLVHQPSSGWTGVSSSQWAVGSLDAQGVIRSNNTQLVHYKGASAYYIIDSSGGTLVGELISTYGGYGSWIMGVSHSALTVNYTGNYCSILNAPTKNGRISLSTYNGDNDNVYLGYISNSHISAGSPNSLDHELRWNGANGSLGVGGIIHPLATKTYDLGTTSLCWRWVYAQWVGSPGGETFGIGANDQRHLHIATNGNIGIGTTSPGYKLHVDGTGYFSDDVQIRNTSYGGVAFTLASSSYSSRIFTISQRDTSGSWVANYMIFGSNGYVGVGNQYPSQMLHVGGNILAEGAVTALSDMRQKSFLANVTEPLENIANLPVFYYRWKDESRDQYLHIGTSAQAVQQIFPELVLGADELSVDYGVLGTTIGILLSKRIIELGHKVKDLEEQIEELKNENSCQ